MYLYYLFKIIKTFVIDTFCDLSEILYLHWKKTLLNAFWFYTLKGLELIIITVYSLILSTIHTIFSLTEFFLIILELVIAWIRIFIRFVLKHRRLYMQSTYNTKWYEAYARYHFFRIIQFYKWEFWPNSWNRLVNYICGDLYNYIKINLNKIMYHIYWKAWFLCFFWLILRLVKAFCAYRWFLYVAYVEFVPFIDQDSWRYFTVTIYFLWLFIDELFQYLISFIIVTSTYISFFFLFFEYFIYCWNNYIWFSHLKLFFYDPSMWPTFSSQGYVYKNVIDYIDWYNLAFFVYYDSTFKSLLLPIYVNFTILKIFLSYFLSFLNNINLFQFIFFVWINLVFSTFFYCVYNSFLEIKLLFFKKLNAFKFLSMLFFITFSYLLYYDFSYYTNYCTSSNFLLFNVEILNIYIDTKSVVFIILITLIYAFSFTFSFYYMIEDKKIYKFVFFLAFFSLSMILLVISNNLILLFSSWELIGISSFFLIGYYNNKVSIFKSALKALFVNKISDIFFIVTILFYFTTNKNFYISSFSSYSFFSLDLIFDFYFFKIDANLLFLVIVTFFCFVKSAQFCFTTWLIDSMDAPVPASALIHSATLVIAGIYIMYRFKLLYLLYPNLINIIILVSSVTSVYAAVCACFQSDLKKILANSTISNCGLLILFLFLSDEFKFLIYTCIHGLLKSLVFILIGFIFSINKHKQDTRLFSYCYFRYNIYMYLIFSSLFLLSAMPTTITYDFKHSISSHSFSARNFLINIIINVNIFLISIFSFFYSYIFIIKLHIYYQAECSNKNILIQEQFFKYNNKSIVHVPNYYFIFVILLLYLASLYFLKHYFFFIELKKNYLYFYIFSKSYIFILINTSFLIQFFLMKNKDYKIIVYINLFYIMLF